MNLSGKNLLTFPLIWRWPFVVGYLSSTLISLLFIVWRFLARYHDEGFAEGTPVAEIWLDASYVFLPEAMCIGLLGGGLLAFWHAARFKPRRLQSWFLVESFLVIGFSISIYQYQGEVVPKANLSLYSNLYGATMGEQFKKIDNSTFASHHYMKTWSQLRGDLDSLSERSHDIFDQLEEKKAKLNEREGERLSKADIDRTVLLGLLGIKPNPSRWDYDQDRLATDSLGRPQKTIEFEETALQYKKFQLMRPIWNFATITKERIIREGRQIKKFEFELYSSWRLTWLILLAFLIGAQLGKLLKGLPWWGLALLFCFVFAPFWQFLNSTIKDMVGIEKLPVAALYMVPLLLWGGLGVLFFVLDRRSAAKAVDAEGEAES